jgi:transcriptional regulator with XRE-family HTH domain
MTTNGNDSSLRSNQKKAIESLLNGFTKAQAATAAGVQPQTLSRWLTEDDFRTELETLSNAAVKDAANRLKATLDTAVSVFQDTMTDKKVSAAVRLRAADMTASHALKLIEFADLAERIERLERRLT